MPNPRWLTPRELTAWEAFLDTSNLLMRRIDRQLREAADLTQAQYELMTRLDQSPERQMRMSDLAARLAVSRGGLTYQVTQLQRRGYVDRRTSRTDERVVWAVLTQEGMAALEGAAPGHVDVVREFLIDRLTPTQLDSLVDILGDARAHLRASES